MLHIHPQDAGGFLTCLLHRESHSLAETKMWSQSVHAAALPRCTHPMEHALTLTAFQGVLGQRSAVFGCGRGAQGWFPLWCWSSKGTDTSTKLPCPGIPRGRLCSGSCNPHNRNVSSGQSSPVKFSESIGGAEERIRTRNFGWMFFMAFRTWCVIYVVPCLLVSRHKGSWGGRQEQCQLTLSDGGKAVLSEGSLCTSSLKDASSPGHHELLMSHAWKPLMCSKNAILQLNQVISEK